MSRTWIDKVQRSDNSSLHKVEKNVECFRKACDGVWYVDQLVVLVDLVTASGQIGFDILLLQ